MSASSAARQHATRAAAVLAAMDRQTYAEQVSSLAQIATAEALVAIALALTDPERTRDEAH
ncbi:MAG: hypothetical protein ACOYD1_07960 [Candidatus Nanopelagicales bacterium]